MDYRDLRASLLTKGETIEDRSGAHAFYFMEVDGRRYRATKVSHGARGQISDELLSAIAKEMRLKTGELKDFVQCSVSREDWLSRRRERGPFRR